MPRIDPTPHVDCRYGAPMGRRSTRTGDVLPSDPPLYLRRVYLDNGGYDPGGAYWGLGQPLYWCGNADGTVDFFLRAGSRAEAKILVREDYPNARFFY
ncbi:hypothetical protein [Novosphingobium meiothermophilum]|uniref:hypothetical protein n=1 Tax=Novosphingobium meiothermophilum TaxID=2202251 RepID=UPI0011AB30A5|nr:hypothetical protein [Novosphingobium meiothermophilum]